MTRHDVLTFDGVTQSIAEWALDYGIPVKTILHRLRKGMSVERAITKPIHVKPGDKLPEPEARPKPRFDFDGRTLTVKEWSAVTGLPTQIIHSRISGGWSIERTLTEPYQPRWGVVTDFGPSTGTGAGSIAQDGTNLSFSTCEVSE